jgi:hypothetical protein
VGLFYSLADEEEEYNFVKGRVAARWFNGHWYDVYANQMLSNRTNIIAIEDNFSISNDLIHLAVCPVVNFNLDNKALIAGNQQCRPSGNKTQATNAITENFIEHNHLKLHPNFPNPANAYTYINFTLKEPSPVNIQLYDSKGSLVLTRNHTAMDEGFQQIYLSTSTLKAGIYTYVIQTSQSRLSSKIIIQP